VTALSGSLSPVLDPEIFDPPHVSEIVGDQDSAVGDTMRRHRDIEVLQA
jgi:hypothetical protein